MPKANIQYSYNKVALKYIWVTFESDTLLHEILISRS